MALFDAHVFHHAQILLKIKEGIKEWAVWEHNERYKALMLLRSEKILMLSTAQKSASEEGDHNDID